ncbi:hypothetical protein LTR67_001512 [Exophiala xenobiotica]
MPPSSEDINLPTVEGSQTASEVDESRCEDRDIQGHTQWNCNKCRERLDGDFDELIQGITTTGQGWTENQIAAVGSFRQFDKTPWPELMPDPSQPQNVQIHTWAWNCVQELQARMNAARAFHEAMTAQHHLQNQGKANITASSADDVVCKDNNGNELHGEWTCHHCLARLDDHFDKDLRESMLDGGWTEARIDAVGSLRQFDTKPWTEMVPDSSQSQLVQVHAWGETRRDEIEARMRNARNFHEARIGFEEVVDKAETG